MYIPSSDIAILGDDVKKIAETLPYGKMLT